MLIHLLLVSLHKISCTRQFENKFSLRSFALSLHKILKYENMMTETKERKLPAGIQSFEKIRKEGYLYVDKTDLIWKLANNGMTYN